jgi:Fur family ferric uptake transcriptional regulator
MSQRLERLCVERGVRMTERRRVIARVLGKSEDHPDVEELLRRVARLDPRISQATVYRTMRIFEEAGLVARVDFGDGRARFELVSKDHHDHLIDTTNGKVMEFRNDKIERLQEEVAREMGYRLVGHRLELYGVPLGPGEKKGKEKRRRG